MISAIWSRAGADQLHGLDRLLHGLPPCSASWLVSLGTLSASWALSLTPSTERLSSSIEAVISSTLELCSWAPGGQRLRALGDHARALVELGGAFGDLADDAGQILEHSVDAAGQFVDGLVSLDDGSPGQVALGGGVDDLQEPIDLRAELFGRNAFTLGPLALFERLGLLALAFFLHLAVFDFAPLVLDFPFALGGPLLLLGPLGFELAFAFGGEFDVLHGLVGGCHGRIDCDGHAADLVLARNVQTLAVVALGHFLHDLDGPPQRPGHPGRRDDRAAAAQE